MTVGVTILHRKHSINVSKLKKEVLKGIATNIQIAQINV